MSMGSQISAFCKDVAKSKKLWSIQFQDGSYIKWCNDDGSEIFPLWSSETRVEKILKYAGQELDGGKPISFSFDEFIKEWVPGFYENNVAVGPNWAGENISGTSFEVNELIERVRNNENF